MGSCGEMMVPKIAVINRISRIRAGINGYLRAVVHAPEAVRARLLRALMALGGRLVVADSWV